VLTRCLAAVAVLVTQAHAAPSGYVYGTLLWIDDPPAFPARFCEGVHSDDAGLADVVVIAEPLDRPARDALRARQPTDQVELDWDEDRAVRVASVSPNGALAITNRTGRELKLKLFARDRLVLTAIASPAGVTTLHDLPEGILRVESDASVEGWVYVTPFPSQVTAGNCRYMFEVPIGRYRVRGWHPFAGERSITVAISRGGQSVVSWDHATKHGSLGPLVFDGKRAP
jgi:hypothetical protein